LTPNKAILGLKTCFSIFCFFYLIKVVLMQLLNLTLAYLLEELKLVEGSFVNKIQELSFDKFKFKLRTREGTKHLLLFPNAVFFSQYKISARKQTSGFGAFLRKRLEGKRILSLKQHRADRILIMEFSDYFLVLELFLNGNLVLTDKNFKILSALKQEKSRNRLIAKNERYFFPDSRKLNPKEMRFDDFKRKFNENFNGNAVLSVVSITEVAPIFVEEIFFKLKLKKDKIKETELKKVFIELKKIYSLKEKLEPIQVTKGKEKIILPFKLSCIKSFIELDSINSALDEFYSKKFFEEKTSDKKPSQFIALEHSHKKQLQAERKLKNQIQENKLKGEALYANNLLIQGIINSIKKGFTKGLSEEEIKEKINSFLTKNNKGIKLISLTKNKAVLDLKE
jgi:predicted ribosome quality control (RQC) complex YloA/Tae2 family protein